MNLIQKLIEAKKKVGYIQKDKKVGEGSLSYMAVTHDQVTAMTRDVINELGILVVPYEVSSETVLTTMTTGKGVPYVRFEAKYEVKFINAENPEEQLTVRITSHALDTGDKAPGKAVSYATKYAILKVLQLETGEDDEGRVAAKAGITDDQLSSWQSDIKNCPASDKLQTLWKDISAKCEQFADKESYAKLKADVTSRAKELKETKNA